MKTTKIKLQIFGFVLVIIVALGLMIQYAQFNSILMDSKKSNITEYNKDLRDRLNSELEYNKGDIRIISHFIETVQWTEETTKEYFKRLVNDDNIIRSIYFGMPSGKLINSDDWIPPMDYNLKERQWYINALEGDDVVVSSEYEDALDGSLIVTLSKSIYDKESDLLGVVAADIKVEDIIRVVEDLTNEILDYSFLIDGEGNILGHKGHVDSEYLQQEALEELNEEKYEKFKKNKSGIELVEINDNSGYLFYNLIEGSDWIIASFISKQNYKNTEAGLWGMFFITLTLAMIVFVSFTYSFKRYFINPTMQFYNDVKKIDPTENVIYRMQYYKDDPFQETRELTNEIIENTESLMKERERNTEEIIAQNEELEASYNQLRAMEQEVRCQNERLIKSEKELEVALEKNRAVNEALPDALFIISREGEILDIQAPSDKLLYIPEEQYIGKHIEDVFSSKMMKNAKYVLENVLKNNEVEQFEYELDGFAGIQKYEVRIAKMNEEQVLAIARNVTKEKELEKQLIDLSYKDQLTNLYNRRYFEEKLEKIDNLSNLPISIIMADINGLKLINDSFGHDAGDQLIKSVGNTILKGCRSEDIVFRISGDEFIIVLTNTEKEIAKKVVERIKNINRDTKLENKELKDLELSVSFGIGVKDNVNMDINDAVKEAEESMYSHKLYEGQKMRLKTIDSMIDSLHKRNSKIKKYTETAIEYTKKLALALNLSPKIRQVIEKTVYYQEVGKITLSEELLHKSKGFTEKELEEINKHSGVGYRVLSTVNEMMEVAKYVLYHHERYDGLGYPEGLKGEEIPFVSRLISVVNSYVSILIEDDYENIGSKDIIEKLREKAGTELDPKLVDIFIKEVLKQDNTRK